jgi:hypothetical protein
MRTNLVKTSKVGAAFMGIFMMAAPLLVGCDRTISSTDTEKTNPDGTVTHTQDTVTQQPNGNTVHTQDSSRN